MFKTLFTLWTLLLVPAGAVLAQTTEPNIGQTEPIAVPLPAPIQVYFPTTQGLTWTYGGNPRELATQIRMLEAQDTNQGTAYLWDSFQGKRWVQNRIDGTVQEYRNGQWRLLFDFNTKEGDSWQIPPLDDADLLNNATLTVVSRSEKLAVPYETLETIHISVKNKNLADAGVTDLWFASGVGLVKWTETTFAGPQSFELASFINRNEPPIISDPLPPIYIDLADYFPTRPGIVWEYAGSPLKTMRKIGMVGIDRKMPASIYLWEGFQGDLRVRKTDDGKIMFVADKGEYLFLDLNAKEGATWTIEGDSNNLLNGSVATLISRNARLEVPYGQFGNVLHLGIKPNPQLADAGVTEMWFAPGIGLVKWTETTFAGPQTYDLTTFIDATYSTPGEPGDTLVVIDPIPFPIPVPERPIEDYENRAKVENSGVQFELGTRQASYIQGDIIEIQYRISALENDATFKFDSGQHYDFHLQNEKGETAWVWSANKSFIFAQTSLTVKAGEAHSFFARIGLEYEYLPAGQYTLQAFMPTSTTQEGTILSEQTAVSLPVEIVSDPSWAILTGTVKDEMGAPVAALISLSENIQSDALYAGSASASWTTRSGTFEMRTKAGEHTLTVRADGFVFHAQNIAINAGENHLDIVLKQEEKDTYTNRNQSVNKRFVTELATDRQAYRPGDKVMVRYRLTNISGQDLTLTFPSGQQYDLTLEGQRGRVWTWSQDKSFIQALSSQTLKAQETFEIETDFVLEDAWAKNNPSFLMTSFLTVSTDQGGQVSRAETEGLVKFAIDGWVLPEERPNALSAHLQTNSEFYKQGDIVTVSYKLTNTSDSTIVLNFNSGQRYDMVLYSTEAIEPIWGWSWARLFTAGTGELVLAPRDTFTFEEDIDLNSIPQITDGVYVVRAYMTSMGELDRDNTESKTRFWLGETPKVEQPPIALPVEPMPTRLLANIDATFNAETAQITYRVVNTTNEVIPLLFRSGQQFDFILKSNRGELWRWSTGRGFTDALHAQTLSPGDSLVVHEQVPLTALTTMPDGTYVLQGYLTVTADERDAAHQIETIASIKFSKEEGQLLLTLTQHGSSQDATAGASRKADFDQNGAVDFADFLNFAAAYGKTSASLGFNPIFDLDSDGTIGFSDFLSFAAGFGQ